MKKLLPLLLLAAATASCTRRPVISGRIEGLTNDTLIVVSCKIADMPDLSDDLDSRIRYDTILARQGGLPSIYRSKSPPNSSYLLHNCWKRSTEGDISPELRIFGCSSTRGNTSY